MGRKGAAGRFIHRPVWTEETVEKYQDYLGGTGIGYKVIWDEVPAGTHPFDSANKIIHAVGALAGTGAPSAAVYRRAGLEEVAKELEKRGLLSG